MILSYYIRMFLIYNVTRFVMLYSIYIWKRRKLGEVAQKRCDLSNFSGGKRTRKHAKIESAEAIVKPNKISGRLVVVYPTTPRYTF